MLPRTAREQNVGEQMAENSRDSGSHPAHVVSELLLEC